MRREPAAMIVASIDATGRVTAARHYLEREREAAAELVAALAASGRQVRVTYITKEITP